LAKPELEFHRPPGSWVAVSDAVPGIWAQVFAEDAGSGAYTGLQRYEPGVDSSPLGVQVHEYWEEVYILDGDLTDLSLGTTFTAGMYACRPPGMRHGPWRTAHGVTMLEIRYR